MKHFMRSPQLSLFEALLININIMLGSGIFINTVILSSYAGAASPLVYLTIGLLFFPLIYTIAQFFKQLGLGTFYDFGKIVHPYVGFISSWSYFTAKMASSVLSMHVFVTLMQHIFPVLLGISSLACDSVLIILFVWLNSFNLRLGSSIQFYFILRMLLVLRAYW
jgi:amino acid transporter